jgi:hypothetical protein
MFAGKKRTDEITPLYTSNLLSGGGWVMINIAEPHTEDNFLIKSIPLIFTELIDCIRYILWIKF